MGRVRGIGVGIVGVALALSVSGCVASEPPYEDLRTEGEATDALPALGQDDVTLDADSARFVGTFDDARIWLSYAAGETCLLVYRTEDDWLTGCGGNGFTLAGGGHSYLVLGDGSATPEGYTAVSANVYAR